MADKSLANVDLEQFSYCDSLVLKQLIEDVGEGLFPELLSIFIDDTRSRCELMAETPLEEREKWCMQLHALKSSAAAYGAMRLHHLCRELEAVCRCAALSDMQRDLVIDEINQALGYFEDLSENQGNGL